MKFFLKDVTPETEKCISEERLLVDLKKLTKAVLNTKATFWGIGVSAAQMPRATKDHLAQTVYEHVETLDTMREIYATPPKPVYESLNNKKHPRLFLALEAHFANLAALPGAVPLEPLVDVTQAVTVTVDGAQLLSGVPTASLQAVAQSFARTRDPLLTYVHQVTTP